MTTSAPTVMPSVQITQPTVLQRQWGTETIVAWTPTHAGKVLARKAGTAGGFQFHVKEESHYLVSGQMRLRSLGADGLTKERLVEQGSAWTVQPGVVHQELAVTDCVVFEVSDPTREDRYAIEPDPGGLPSMTTQAAVIMLQAFAEALRNRAAACYTLADTIEADGLPSLVPR